MTRNTSPVSEPFAAPPVESAWKWSRDQIRDWQLQELNKQFRQILPTNRFYREKYGDSIQLKTLNELPQLPITTKEELVASADSQSNGLSLHHTYPQGRYSRLHRTSGTTGLPLMISDTADDWRWWSSTWQHVLHAARVTAEDRVFLAFSFGPFIGFWSAHQACVDRGCTVIPGGGLSSLARLEFMRQTESTVVFCTPSYALHLGELAQAENFPLAELPVTRLIVAGEAGGSIPAVRERMANLWNAEIIDHSGATEIGPWGFGIPEQPGLHVIETAFIAELLPREATDDTALISPNSLPESSRNERMHDLVITSLGRYGAPVIRFKTGDVVSTAAPPNDRCGFLWMPNGVVGRGDSMLTIRGVNVFPSSIDAVVRGFPAIAEYQVQVSKSGQLDQIAISIESESNALQQQLEKQLSVRLGLRIPVTTLAVGSLPRSQGGKLQRWKDER